MHSHQEYKPRSQPPHSNPPHHTLRFKHDQLAAQMHSRDAGSPYGTEELDPCG